MAVSDETLHEMAAACYAASWSSWPSLSDLRNAALTSDETLHEMAAACYAASRWSWPSLSDLRNATFNSNVMLTDSDAITPFDPQDSEQQSLGRAKARMSSDEPPPDVTAKRRCCTFALPP